MSNSSAHPKIFMFVLFFETALCTMMLESRAVLIGVHVPLEGYTYLTAKTKIALVGLKLPGACLR